MAKATRKQNALDIFDSIPEIKARGKAGHENTDPGEEKGRNENRSSPATWPQDSSKNTKTKPEEEDKRVYPGRPRR